MTASAFAWRAGVATDIGTPAGAWSQAAAVNGCGQAVGASGSSLQDAQAAMWSLVTD